MGFSHLGSRQQQALEAYAAGSLRVARSAVEPTLQMRLSSWFSGHWSVNRFSLQCSRRLSSQSVASKPLVLCAEMKSSGKPSGYHIGSAYMFLSRRARSVKSPGSTSNLHHAFETPSRQSATFIMSSSSIIHPLYCARRSVRPSMPLLSRGRRPPTFACSSFQTFTVAPSPPGSLAAYRSRSVSASQGSAQYDQVGCAWFQRMVWVPG
mmetsp:Transcript_12965/g.38575  ORF Transcript_12965/g.38575 Transcript_12965/m.38575 type:complete len:208 (+) Transcript_12965:93-716(+)